MLHSSSKRWSRPVSQQHYCRVLLREASTSLVVQGTKLQLEALNVKTAVVEYETE